MTSGKLKAHILLLFFALSGLGRFSHTFEHIDEAQCHEHSTHIDHHHHVCQLCDFQLAGFHVQDFFTFDFRQYLFQEWPEINDLHPGNQITWYFQRGPPALPNA